MKKVIIWGGVLGLVLGGIMMFLGLSHNPQGEFTNDPLWLLTLGLSWAVPVWLVTVLVAFLFHLRAKKLEKNNH